MQERRGTPWKRRSGDGWKQLFREQGNVLGSKVSFNRTCFIAVVFYLTTAESQYGPVRLTAPAYPRARAAGWTRIRQLSTTNHMVLFFFMPPKSERSTVSDSEQIAKLYDEFARPTFCTAHDLRLRSISKNSIRAPLKRGRLA